jgi:hypothetical protein
LRTTLTLDPDVFIAARKLAEARSESIGKVVSELARRGLLAPPAVRAGKGFPVFAVPAGASPLTLADVQRGEDEA